MLSYFDILNDMSTNKLFNIWAASNETNDFEHAQNMWIRIILHMRKVSYGHLLSI